MRITLIHGFNVRDGGARTVDRLAPFLEGMGHTVDCDSADYGWHDLLMVRFFHDDAVLRIADALLHADAVVTHSNGANYCEQALALIGKDMPVFHLSPALNRDFTPASTQTHVLHTQHDKAVKWARLLRWHPWGAAGAYGATDESVRNYDFSYRVNGHSGWFRGLNSRFFAHRISKLL